MTKNELMEMARECGAFLYGDEGAQYFDIESSQLEKFANAILERAAESIEPIDNGDHEFDPYVLGHFHAAQQILSLKLPTN